MLDLSLLILLIIFPSNDDCASDLCCSGRSAVGEQDENHVQLWAAGNRV